MRLCLVLVSLRPRDQPRDLLRVESLVVAERGVGIAAQTAKQVTQFGPNDLSAQDLVSQPEVLQEVAVEKVTEGAVAHVV